MIGTIHIRHGCQDRDPVRRQSGAGSGAALRTTIAARLAAPPWDDAFAIVPESCMGPCGAGLRLAVTGPGRWGWLFEGLHAESDLDAFLQFLAAWRAAPNGVPAKAERPARLSRKTVGRLPPSAARVHPIGPAPADGIFPPPQAKD
jgi:predicted metal-binding protein